MRIERTRMSVAWERPFEAQARTTVAFCEQAKRLTGISGMLLIAEPIGDPA